MRKNAGKIMTVLGPIDPDMAGPTLSHEHLVVDLSMYAIPSTDPEEARQFHRSVTLDNLHYLRFNPYVVKENCIIRNTEDDIDFLVKEAKLFAKAGGKTIVDVTMDGIGRDVEAAREISKRAGVNVVSGCGNYVKASHPVYVAELSDEKLAQKYIGEIQNGFGETGIRPGIIGEIGTGKELEKDEIKVLRAAAMAQSETGLPINIHIPCSSWEHTHRILDILENAGADISHVALSHRCGCLVYPSLKFDDAIEHLEGLAQRGCYIEFDLVGCVYPFFTPTEVLWNHPSDRERAQSILALCQRGYSKNILLSHDACYRSYFSSYGGWAWTHVLTTFRHILKKVGISDYDYEKFMIHNPARMLTIR